MWKGGFSLKEFKVLSCTVKLVGIDGSGPSY